MYTVSVPLKNRIINRKSREAYLNDMQRCGVKRIFLAVGTYSTDEIERKRQMHELSDNCRYFRENGFEVGAWLWTFMVDGKNTFTKMKALDGSQRDCCPLDENFRGFVGEYIKDVAKCGVDLIMFDDDYRFGFRPGMHCVCDRHMEKIENILHESITAEEISGKIFYGGKNKYRDAYMDANRESLILFAQEMRRYVDEIDSNIRLGLCACMSTWDNDGVDSATLSRVLAGKTKPFLRLIGAPYWASTTAWGNRLQNVIELHRMERSWCGDGIEIFCEGDTFPRPRHKVPSVYLELSDIAMRADGTTDGILKYMEDYFSSPSYEKGYINAHIKNTELYKRVEKAFSDKYACGIRVYEKMNKLRNAVIPKNVEGKCEVENIFFSIAGRMLSDSSVPSVYCGSGVCGISFGENADMLTDDELKNGVIIDRQAAAVLERKGIDTGVKTVGDCAWAKEEYFFDYDEYTRAGFGAYVTELKENAVVKSSFIYDNDKKAPLSYYYRNDSGHKFLVFNFDAYFNGEDIYRSYLRSRQIAEAPEVFGGKRLPAYSYGHPDLYIMCKKNENSMAVGLWNMFADEIDKPMVELDDCCKRIDFINCSGKIEGNKVYLSSIMPFSFAAFEVFYD